jgi:Icc-related predicted phosphoesterase
MRIVCISDTHNYTNINLPEADLLLHGGDHTGMGTPSQLSRAVAWLQGQRRKYTHGIVSVGGNRDFGVQKNPEEFEEMCEEAGIIYLCDAHTTIEGIKIYGSPWTPIFGRWAFMLEEEELEKKWKLIPDDADIVLTHGPPYGRRDVVARGGFSVGCKHLRNRLLEVKPKYHVFGHIHEAYGIEKSDDTTFVNASICTFRYQPTNAPIIIEV